MNKYFKEQSEHVNEGCESFGYTLDEFIENIYAIIAIEDKPIYNIYNLKSLIKFKTHQIYRKHCE